MAGVIVIFDFDSTIIEIDSDNWVLDHFGLTEKFYQLLPNTLWNPLMNKIMNELHSQGKTIEEIIQVVKKTPIHPRIVPAIEAAYSLGCSNSMLLQPFFPTNNSYESQKSSENTNTTYQCDGKNQKEDSNTYLVIGQSVQVDAKFRNSQHEFFPATTGDTSDNKSMEHDNVFHSISNAQSGMNPTWTPKSMFQKESSPFPTSISSHSNPKSQNSEARQWSDDTTYTCDLYKNDQSNIDCAMDDSPSNGQGCGTSFYHDAENRNTSGVCEGTGSGSDGNAPQSVVGKNHLESSISHDHYDELRDANCHRTSHREAALTKFRLKRKDRCYDKKVRYESRKRQADKRPRVKGQFVRQVQSVLAVDTGGY